MAHEKISAWPQKVPEPVYKLILSLRVEINHDISTEDYVKRPLHGPGIHQVQPCGPDDFSNFGT